MGKRFINTVKETTRQNSIVKDSIEEIKEQIMVKAQSGRFHLTIPVPIWRVEVKNYLQSEGFFVRIDEDHEHEVWMHISWNV